MSSCNVSTLELKKATISVRGMTSTTSDACGEQNIFIEIDEEAYHSFLSILRSSKTLRCMSIAQLAPASAILRRDCICYNPRIYSIHASEEITFDTVFTAIDKPGSPPKCDACGTFVRIRLTASCHNTVQICRTGAIKRVSCTHALAQNPNRFEVIVRKIAMSGTSKTTVWLTGTCGSVPLVFAPNITSLELVCHVIDLDHTSQIVEDAVIPSSQATLLRSLLRSPHADELYFESFGVNNARGRIAQTQIRLSRSRTSRESSHSLVVLPSKCDEMETKCTRKLF